MLNSLTLLNLNKKTEPREDISLKLEKQNNRDSGISDEPLNKDLFVFAPISEKFREEDIKKMSELYIDLTRNLLLESDDKSKKIRTQIDDFKSRMGIREGKNPLIDKKTTLALERLKETFPKDLSELYNKLFQSLFDKDDTKTESFKKSILALKKTNDICNEALGLPKRKIKFSPEQSKEIKELSDDINKEVADLNTALGNAVLNRNAILANAIQEQLNVLYKIQSEISKAKEHLVEEKKQINIDEFDQIK